jgi:hypothetical protein
VEEKKVCGRCGVKKKLDEFPVNRKAKDGRYYLCKPCKVKYNGDSRKKVTEKRISEGSLVVRRPPTPQPSPEHKYCYGCSKWKHRDEFHNCKKHGKQGKCKTCKTADNDNWKARNPDKVKEAHKRWAEANPDKLQEATTRYRNSHKKQCKEATNKWRAKSKDKIKQYEQQYRRDHADQINIKNNNRRARLLGAGGTFTKQEWEQACHEFDDCCAYCKLPKKLTKHHLIPLIKGGSNWIGNLIPACGSCNSKIGDSIVYPW